MYNHPYFKKQNICNGYQECIPTHQSIYPTRPANGYIPIVVDAKNPNWIEDESTMLDIVNKFKPVKITEEDGYIVDDYGFITSRYGDISSVYDGIIHAMVITPDDDGAMLAHTQIMNTENGGFRHVTNVNGNMADSGPVQNVCLVGNYDRPEGLYIPLCNLKAVADGVVLLESYFKNNILNQNSNAIATTPKCLENK